MRSRKHEVSWSVMESLSWRHWVVTEVTAVNVKRALGIDGQDSEEQAREVGLEAFKFYGNVT
jgi:hypothetical protein